MVLDTVPCGDIDMIMIDPYMACLQVICFEKSLILMYLDNSDSKETRGLEGKRLITH